MTNNEAIPLNEVIELARKTPMEIVKIEEPYSDYEKEIIGKIQAIFDKANLEAKPWRELLIASQNCKIPRYYLVPSNPYTGEKQNDK